jgi:hypothetical protein
MSNMPKVGLVIFIGVLIGMNLSLKRELDNLRKQSNDELFSMRENIRMLKSDINLNQAINQRTIEDLNWLSRKVRLIAMNLDKIQENSTLLYDLKLIDEKNLKEIKDNPLRLDTSRDKEEK